MKVTLNWLKQYVDFDWSPEQLKEALTMLGLEVEGVQRLGGEFEGIVVSQVLSREKHPNADKLTVCRVNDGTTERQIVCGAQNFQAGDKVPLVLPGATLPLKPGEKEPFTIKVGRIRGVESHGMMCSPKELGISEDAAGLLILRPDAIVGQPFAQYLGRAPGDIVYDLEITPNRPDLNSVLGIAREIAAVSGRPLKKPELNLPEGEGQPAAELVSVRLEDPELCPRYNARVVRGVKIGPSPDWLRNVLEHVGLRSINNVVDATNYVMLETGQPLHAFDYRLVAKGLEGKPTIVVRRAQAGERFVTLDGQEHTLTSEMLLIADDQKAIALAGVMGGQNSEISGETSDVLLESAWFNPTNVRRTSKALGLRTDASYRFERGADIAMADWASRRCTDIILATAGGQLAPGGVDAYPQPFAPRQITLRHAKVNELLGIQLRPEEIEYFLGQLGLKIVGRKPQPVGSTGEIAPVTLEIPTWRVDLKRETDLIEEVERLYGVQKVPATPPRGAIGSNAFDAVHDEIAHARRLLVGLGACEAQGQTLVGEPAARLVAETGTIVPLANPLSSEMNVLRPSLLPGLLDSLRHNLAHRNQRVALFEVGRVFSVNKDRVAEERCIALALTGQAAPVFWQGSDRGACYDVFDLKGMLEEFLENFGVRGVAWTRRAEPTRLFAESAVVQLGKHAALGQLGQVLPTLAKQYDLRDPVFMAELSLDLLLARRKREPTFEPLPAFPAIRRDVAMVVDQATTHESIVQVIKQARPSFLVSIELFDVYRGTNVPPGRKSVAYALTYRNPERTLTDTEVNATHEQVLARLRESLGAALRE